MKRNAAAEKVMVLGIDGMDPRLTVKYVAEGKMPNVKALMDRGSCREDLVMLGGHPTVTPPMWTTLATGAYAVTHGITGFFRHSKDELDVMEYNLDSRLSKAEPLWNCFVDAGKKTLVWHWPGSSWPPTSDSPNLYVVDGTSPGSVCMGPSQIESELLVGASPNLKEVTFLRNVTDDVTTPCVITGLEIDNKDTFDLESVMSAPDIRMLLLGAPDGSLCAEIPIDVAQSPIKDATGWADAPADAKEFTILLSGGLLRRPCLIYKNAEGIYDTIGVFKSKKDTAPLGVLKPGVITEYIKDEAIRGDDRFNVVRNMKILKLAPDASELKMWVSAAVDIDNDSVFHPKSLYQTIVDNAGYPVPTTQIGDHDSDLITECTLANWYVTADWQAKAINHMIEKEGVEAVFSHFHNIDLQSHKFIKFMKDKGLNKRPESVYEKFMEDVYVQTDYYIGKYMHLLDEGWSIALVSDHAQVCPTHGPVHLGDILGVNVVLMEELGFTTLKRDAEGNRLREIDWEKTKAIAIRETDIYINLKGRDKNGIVDPEDKYELEEEIMTALYGYKHPKTGKRVVSLALRNKDAVLLGMGGPECGDITYFTAEGYNYDHADTLSTTYGEKSTSVSPIFIGAGPGFKKNFRTSRIIRQVDVAPTMALIGGVRIPAECEGAPIYQIMEQEVGACE